MPSLPTPLNRNFVSYHVQSSKVSKIIILHEVDLYGRKGFSITRVGKAELVDHGKFDGSISHCYS